MKFRYSARTKSGELQVGYVEALHQDAASNILTGHGLYVLSLESIREHRTFRAFFNFLNRVKAKDLVIFTRQFATMLEAKVRIDEGLRTLFSQTKNPILKEAIFEVSADIDAGLSLSQAMERQSAVFSEFYVNLIRSAEVTGRIEEAMQFLADHLEKEFVLTTKVKNAMIYPVFVILLFFVVGGILIGLVFPQITPIFTESQVELPFLTKILLNSGIFLSHWWVAVVATAGFLGAGLYAYIKTAEGRALVDQFSLQAPVMGNLFKKLYLARFSETASVLIKGGIPIAQAMEITSRTIGSTFYGEMLHDVAEGVRRGELLSQALEKNPRYFLPLLTQMVAVGEKTGKLEEMFIRVFRFYSREVDTVIDNLVEFIQPALIVVIGGAVGALFASVLYPLYSLIQKF